MGRSLVGSLGQHQGLLRGHLNICLYLMKRPATPLSKIGMEVMKNSPTEMFITRLSLAGSSPQWYMDVSCGRRGEDCGHYFDDTAYRAGRTTHIVVGSVEILYLVFNGTLPERLFSGPSPFYTCRGTICGGAAIFALMSHARDRNDMSNSVRKKRGYAASARNGSGKKRKNSAEWRRFNQSGDATPPGE